MHLYSVIIICFQYSDDTSETTGARKHSRESAAYYVLIGPFFIIVITIIEVIFPNGSMVKNPPANVGDLGSNPGLGRSPGEGNGNLSSILAWKIPWTKKPGGL